MGLLKGYYYFPPGVTNLGNYPNDFHEHNFASINFKILFYGNNR